MSAAVRALVERKIRLHVQAIRDAMAEAQYCEAVGDTAGLAAHEAAIRRRRAAFRQALTDELARLGYAVTLGTTPAGDPDLVDLTRPEAA